MKQFHTILLLLVLQLAAHSGHAQKRTDQPWQVDLAAGLHAFYAPVQNVKWQRPELLTIAGFGKPLGPRQNFGVTLQIGYARNNYQGDALFLQLLGQFTPLLAKKIEFGIGTGVGYRIAFYPSASYKWSGNGFANGTPFKGMLQVPLQLSLGYRSVHLNGYQLRPYIAYQQQALFGYNPDMSPLPASAILLGFKLLKP